jgi:hypothetical protein
MQDVSNIIKCMENNSPQYPLNEPVNTKFLLLQGHKYLKFLRIMVGVKLRHLRNQRFSVFHMNTYFPLRTLF